YVVEASFEVDKKIYIASCQLKCRELKYNELQTKLLNLEVPVIYSPKHVSLNYVLIEKDVYDFYHVPIPDSLLWLDEFVRCK
ncbi:hypothetical protein, partial [Salmonella enterica]|uniref:hypothetical protein n=1 Tax=Salmonella enterica TaxID=28901 RepID=UPI0032B3AF09